MYLCALSRFAALAVLLPCFFLSLPAQAETLIWNGPGDPGNTGDSRQVPDGSSTGLFPSLTSPSGNSVRVSGPGPDPANPPAVFGGLAYAHSGDATGSASHNNVTVNGNALAHDVYGGEVRTNQNLSVTANARGDAARNTVTIGGSAVVNQTVHGGYVHSNSGSAMGSVVGNSVTVMDNAQTLYVYGGSLWSGVEASGSAVGNSVTVTGNARAAYVYGGSLSGSDGVSGSATGNRVTVTGNARVSRNVYGGALDNTSNGISGSATHNSVVISGLSHVGRNIYGGYVEASTDASGSVTHNTVTLMDSPTFGTDSLLYGGLVVSGTSGEATGDPFTGNTLNLWNYTGGGVASLRNFQNYNFILPASLKSGDTLLTVSGDAYFNDSLVFSPPYYTPVPQGRQSTVTGVSFMGGGTPLKPGDRINLITAQGNNAQGGNTGLRGTVSNEGAVIKGVKGATLDYRVRLLQDREGAAGSLYLLVDDVKASPKAETLALARLTEIIVINQGGDLVAGLGMQSAVNAAWAGQRAAQAAGPEEFNSAAGGPSRRGDITGFTAVSGGHSRYSDGSYMDVDSYNFLTGLAWGHGFSPGRLTLGAFFEAGFGDYDVHAGGGSGDGDVDYYGGGILARFDFAPVRLGHFYLEGSGRLGRVGAEYSSSDLRDALGENASYSISSTYYSLHGGLGFIWALGESMSLDTYAKYFWAHENSAHTTVCKDPIEFESVDSHRWRGGARFSWAMNEYFAPYLGGSYEYEFDGKARATTYGYAINAPELKGGTGMAEAGLSLTPLSGSGLSLDLGVQGYTGTREGVAGSFQVRVEF